VVLRLLLPSRPTATGCDIICEDPEDARRHDFYETAKDAGCSEDEDAELLTPVAKRRCGSSKRRQKARPAAARTAAPRDPSAVPRKRKESDGAAAEDRPAKKRAKQATPQAPPTDPKAAAKAARLAKRGVSAERLATFAKLAAKPAKAKKGPNGGDAM